MGLRIYPQAVKVTAITIINRCSSFSVQNVGTGIVTVSDGIELNIQLAEGQGINFSAFDGGFYQEIEIDSESSEAIITANLCN